MIERPPQPDAPLFGVTRPEPNRLGMPVGRFLAMRGKLPPLSHRAGPATERPPSAERLNALEADALEFIAAARENGATFDEWAEARGLDQSHSGRFTALHERGLIRDSKVLRPTRRGRSARVFVLSTPTPTRSV